MNSVPAPSQASLACLKHNLAFLLDCFGGRHLSLSECFTSQEYKNFAPVLSQIGIS